MNILVFFGVVLVIAYAQANTENLRPFFERFMDVNYFESEENPSNFKNLCAKIYALDYTIQQYNVNKEVYKSELRIFDKILHIKIRTPDDVLNDLHNKQDEIDAIFDELIQEKALQRSSEINDRIDEFVRKYVASSIELFDSIIMKSKNLEENAEEIFKKLSKLIDIFAENIGKCLVIPKTEFKEIYQCRQNARNILPNLTSYFTKLDNLDGMKSLKELVNKIRDSKIRWDRRIDELK